jgi:D-arginine dehydrogenase
MSSFDVAIVGAGMAGASLAAELGNARSVLLLEAENLPGYHSTGRSAAFWSETYGGPLIQPLTSASHAFLASPPDNFSETPFLTPRGALHLGQANDVAATERLLKDFERSSVRLQRLSHSMISEYIQGLKTGWSEALLESDCSDIDVAALHAAYLKAAKKAGVQLICNAPLTEAHFSNGLWSITGRGLTYTAKLLVNAAGAWADPVAQLAGIRPTGITPYRRTIAQLAVEPAAPADLPLVIGIDGSFYFKPEAGGRIWLSPHDEIPSAPCDAAPEELDIALAIDRFQEVVDWRITKLERKWAGLRSFAPDRLPVIGRDPAIPEFFWLAGQGGFGIQTAPAIATLAASMILEQRHHLQDVDASQYDPARFQ